MAVMLGYCSLFCLVSVAAAGLRSASDLSYSSPWRNLTRRKGRSLTQGVYLIVGDECSLTNPGSPSKTNPVFDYCHAFGGSGLCLELPIKGDGKYGCACEGSYTAYYDLTERVVACIPNNPCAASTSGGQDGDADCALNAQICAPLTIAQISTFTTAALVGNQATSTLLAYTCVAGPCETDTTDSEPCNNQGDTSGKCIPITGTNTYTCTCSTGYSFNGKSCVPAYCSVLDAQDKNPCNDGGDTNSTCISTSSTTFTCACSSGFVFNGATCSDIDECGSSTSCSNGVCTNYAGSYSCSCDAGFYLSSSTCTDYDECSVPTTCREAQDLSASCLNTQGSYVCYCSEGYQSQWGTCIPYGSDVIGFLNGLLSVLLNLIILPLVLPALRFARLLSVIENRQVPTVSFNLFDSPRSGRAREWAPSNLTLWFQEDIQ